MLEKILELLEARKFASIREILNDANEVDIAALFEELPEEYALRVFRLLPKEVAADVFSYMSNDIRQNIIEAITDQELSGIIDELFLDDTVDLIEEMPATVVKKVLANTDSKKRALINRFLQYKEDSAGSIMTIEFVDLKKEMTVRQAFEYIRRTGVDKETIYTCFVTNKSRTLEGVVTVKDLLLSDDDEIIENIMDTNIIYVSTDDDKEVVAKIFDKYSFLSLPVVDKEKRLVGIVTFDDAIDVIQDENTEDFEKMAAIIPSDEPYLKTSPFKHARHRLPWLLLLMISATFTGAIITSFQEKFMSVAGAALVAFIPMLMDTGGNCGSQTSTLTIRGMSLGQIQGRDVLKVWWQEISVAVMTGAVLAIVNIVRIYLLNGRNILLALTVSLSLYATVIIAQSVGCLLPIGAKKIGLDPAVTASPLITTIVDACALSIYFVIAKIILPL
ncbi:MAG: magnesium transporter [Clostridia bacterium]|nr:magnesium transporter [Clostridia bacterium]